MAKTIGLTFAEKPQTKRAAKAEASEKAPAAKPAAGKGKKE